MINNNEAVTLNVAEIRCVYICVLVTLIFVFLAFFWKIFISITQKCKKKSLKQSLKEILYKYRWDIAFSIGILSTIIIFWILLAHAIFALVSVFLAFKAFSSQTLAAKRASFDATFTQIFAQHSILYKKVQCPSMVHCHFAGFRRYFQFRIYYNAGPVTNQQIWEEYNRRLQIGCGEECSSNFKNYFKYIYKEVTYIRDNSAGLLNDADKRQYVGLIEGQMNNDELFCYLVNLLEYYEKNTDNQKLISYFEYLKQNAFFKEICKTDGYKDDVKKAFDLLNESCRNRVRNSLIEETWLK